MGWQIKKVWWAKGCKARRLVFAPLHWGVRCCAAQEEMDGELESLLWVILIIFAVGLFAYKVLFSCDWVDAFYYTCTTTSTLQLIPSSELVTTSSQKVFVSFYSLASSLLFIVLAWYLVEQLLIHR